MRAGKGQISIEFIFTIVSFFSIAIVLSVISAQFTEHQSEIHIRSQEKKIAESVAEIAGVSAIYDQQEAKGTVRYRIPEMHLLGKSSGIPCTVAIENAPGSGQIVKVSAKYNEKTIEETVSLVKPSSLPLLTVHSGEYLDIDYT